MVACAEGAPLSAVPHDPNIGRTIAGKYAVREVLAKGGMGVIYKAEQIGLGRIIALKMLLAQRERDATFEQRFSLEASTLAKLKHPNTVTLYDYGFAEDEQHYFMAMEYVEGQNLARVVKAQGAFAPMHALKIIYECARALQEAHGIGIVHRDLKPANIMVAGSSEGETVKILDFGIAKIIQPAPDQLDLTDDQTMLGSPKFMAPEQIRHGNAVDARTDVYSLGAVLYFLLAGTEPFTADTQVQILMAHLTAPLPPLKAGLNVPPQVEAIVRKCMEKEQVNRYQSMEELKTAIRGVLGELEAGPTNPTMSKKRLPVLAEPKEGMSPMIPVLAAVALLVLVVSGIAGVVGVAALGVGVAGVATTAPEGEPPVVRAAIPAAVSVPVAPVVAPVPQLTITSEPSGATVYDGETALGATPYTLDWTLGATSDPRTLEVRLDGYDVGKVSLGAIEADTRQHLALAPKAVVKAAPRTVVKPAPDAKPDDLMMER